MQLQKNDYLTTIPKTMPISSYNGKNSANNGQCKNNCKSIQLDGCEMKGQRK